MTLNTLSIFKATALAAVTCFTLASCGGKSTGDAGNGKDSLTEKKVKNDLTNDFINGRVKSITDTKYVIDGDVKGALEEKNVSSYTPEGFMTEYATYGADGKLSFKYAYTYKSPGKPTEVSWSREDGKIYQKEEYKYDDKGNKIEAVKNDIENESKSKRTSKFDDKGNEIETTGYDMDDKPSFVVTYTYDNDGNATEIVGKGLGDKSDKAVKTTVKYASGCPTIAETFNKDNKVVSREVYTYDKDAHLTQIDMESGLDSESPEKITRKNENFDKEGNWLKQTLIVNGKPATVTERVIVYN